MPRAAPHDATTRDRPGRRTRGTPPRGMRLLRVWVPDPHAPGFREEAHRQALLLRGAPEEAEALDLIAALADADEPEA